MDYTLKKKFGKELEFSRWLAKDGLAVLSEAVDMSLTLKGLEVCETEHFITDAIFENDKGEKIIVENQFGKSDHDHLGKTLSYTINGKAKYSIWLAESFHSEHLTVLQWINEVSKDLKFYAFQAVYETVNGKEYFSLIPVVLP